jgi:nucleoid-associated protein YgaU
MALLVVFMEPAASLVGKILRLEEPTTNEIVKGDWLSKLALKHYGDASYWRELALVNRAPNPDLIFPKEEVIVPSFEAIQKIREANSLSSVNNLMSEQEAIVAGRNESTAEPVVQEPEKSVADSQEAPGAQPRDRQRVEGSGDVAVSPEDQDLEPYPSVDNERQAANGADPTSFLSSTPVIIGLVILGLVLLMGIFVVVANKKRREERLIVRDSQEREKEEEENSWYHEQKDAYPEEDEERVEGTKKRRKVTEITK